MEPSTLLMGEVVCMLALAVVGTVLVVGGGVRPWFRKPRERTRPSEVPVVLFCPRIRTPAKVTLAATLPPGSPAGARNEPELSVVDCEYLSRTGLKCDFSCLEEQPTVPT